MSENTQASDTLQGEAMALANAVTNYADFGEMAHALRVARRELNGGVLAIDDAEVARKRLGDGLRIIGLARERWIALRA